MDGTTGSGGIVTLKAGIPMNGDMRAALKKIHDKKFAEYEPLDGMKREKKIGPAYREAVYNLIVSASKEHINVDDALHYHKAEKYKRKIKEHDDHSGGQVPGAICHLDDTGDFTSRILAEGHEKVHEKMEHGAVFCNADDLHHDPAVYEKQIERTQDFIASAFINGHMVGKHDVVPYEAVVETYGEMDKLRALTPKDKIIRGSMRQRKLIADWKGNGFQVEELNGYSDRVLYNKVNDREEHTYMILLLHMLKECRYYVVNKGQSIEFGAWLHAQGLDSSEIVQKQMQNLQAHEKEAPYFETLVNWMRGRKGIYCVDKRHRRDIGGTIKKLGSRTTLDERIEVMGNPFIQSYLPVCIHLRCGYFTTGMLMHESGDEIRRIVEAGLEKGGLTDDIEKTVDQFRRGIRTIFDKAPMRFDFDLFIHRLERIGGQKLTNQTAHMLRELFKSSLSDTRNTAAHLREHDMLVWDERLQTIVMPSAVEIESMSGQDNPILPGRRSADQNVAKLQQIEYFDRVTLRIAVDEQHIWNELVATDEHRERIMALRKEAAMGTAAECTYELLPRIKVEIEDFRTGRVLLTRDGKTVYDAVIGEHVDIF